MFIIVEVRRRPSAASEGEMAEFHVHTPAFDLLRAYANGIFADKGLRAIL